MRSFVPLKISTASILTLVFVFRLLFINCSLISFLSSSKSENLNNQHQSLLSKRKLQSEVSNSIQVDKYVIMEACEERTDKEENMVKNNFPVLLSILQTLFKAPELADGSTDHFESIKCRIFPKRYLSISVLRI